MGIIKRLSGFLLGSAALLLLTQCAAFKSGTQYQDSLVGLTVDGFCDSSQVVPRFMINDLETEVDFRDETYHAKLNMYVQQDSLFFLSAVNSGFELLRAGVFPDSIVIIDRTDKTVIIQHFDTVPSANLITFKDLSLLFDKSSLCDIKEKLVSSEGYMVYDYSTQDVKRVIHFNANNLEVFKFEFFNKKTGDYLLGEMVSEGVLEIYANYLIGPATLYCSNGKRSSERFPRISLRFNKAKYSVIYP